MEKTVTRYVYTSKDQTGTVQDLHSWNRLHTFLQGAESFLRS